MSIVDVIFGFTIDTLMGTAGAGATGDGGHAPANDPQGLAPTAVETLRSYLEWIPVKYVYQRNLLALLCSLLVLPAAGVGSSGLDGLAAECMLLVASRKAKADVITPPAHATGSGSGSGSCWGHGSVR